MDFRPPGPVMLSYHVISRISYPNFKRLYLRTHLSYSHKIWYTGSPSQGHSNESKNVAIGSLYLDILAYEVHVRFPIAIIDITVPLTDRHGYRHVLQYSV